jgi:hypothetical protein
VSTASVNRCSGALDEKLKISSISFESFFNSWGHRFPHPVTLNHFQKNHFVFDPLFFFPKFSKHPQTLNRACSGGVGEIEIVSFLIYGKHLIDPQSYILCGLGKVTLIQNLFHPLDCGESLSSN